MSSPLNITANMTITGRRDDHPELYVIQPAGGVKETLIDISGAKNVTLHDLTLQGGSTTGDGGAIDDSTVGGRLTLEDAVIRNNSAGGDGGGVYMADGAGLSIAESTFGNNKAGHDGGGMYFNASSQNTKVNVRTSGFNDDKAGNDGGGMLVQATPPSGASPSQPPAVDATVKSTAFVRNTSGNDGGGMWNNDVTSLTADRVFAADNTDVVDSGALGLSVMQLNSTSFTFTNGYVTGNRTTGPGTTTTPDAGGVCFDFQTAGATGKVTATVKGNVFTDNPVAGAGGGMFLRDKASGTTFNATVSDNLFAGNRADNTSPDPEGDAGEGGGLYAEATAASNKLTLDGNVFAGNSAARDGGLYLRIDSGTAAVRRNLFLGNHADNDGGGIYLTGNTAAGTPGGTVNLSDDGLIGNTAGNDGGGLYVDKTGVANLVHDLIILSKAGTAGGGVFNDGGSVAVKDSVIAHNTAPTDPNFSGRFTDEGGNTIG